jgi:proteasome lid subunit RPN8/RPN11
MAIRVKREHVESINKHGEQEYPRECCGFLLGVNTDGVNILGEIYPAQNVWEKESHYLAAGESGEVKKQESQLNRYLITPDQYRQADTYARERSWGIIGYYHSHPDHPAAPSGYDLDHSCWPGESYIIVSIQQGKAAALNSFTKPDYTEFEQEEVLIEE